MDQTPSGYDANFLDNIGDYYKCIICHLVVRDPVLLVECGHRFCKICFEKMREHATHMNNQLLCPTDRSKVDISKVYDDVSINRVVLDFQVKCDNSVNGCQWTGELRHLENHLDSNNCGFKQKEQAFILQQIDERLEHCEKHISEGNEEFVSLQVECFKQVEALSSIKSELRVFEKRIKLSEDKLAQRISLLEKNYEQCSKSAQKSDSTNSQVKEGADNTNTSPYHPRRHTTGGGYVTSAGNYNRRSCRSGKSHRCVTRTQEEVPANESSSQDETRNTEIERTNEAKTKTPGRRLRYSLRDSTTSNKRSYESTEATPGLQ